MVLKLYEAESSFTVGIIFTLYALFESILVFKPFSTSPLSSGQYIVCKGLKDLKTATEIKEMFLKAYNTMIKSPQSDFEKLIDYNIIENEDALKQNITNLNNANLTARADLLKVALTSLSLSEGDKLSSKYGVDNTRAFEIKCDLLRGWSVPVQSTVGPAGPLERNSNK